MANAYHGDPQTRSISATPGRWDASVDFYRDILRFCVGDVVRRTRATKETATTPQASRYDAGIAIQFSFTSLPHSLLLSIR